MGAYSSLALAHTPAKPFQKLNAHMVLCGWSIHVLLGQKVVRFYSKHGSLQNGRQILDKMSKRLAFPWNALLSQYACSGQYDEALSIYFKMLSAGICPDNFTYAFALKACAGLSALRQGQKIHGQIVVSGYESDVFLTTTLVDMYAKCLNTEDARQVFDEMPRKDVVSWNAMIAGYAHSGRVNEALMLFYQMRCEDVVPELSTMMNVLPAFSESGDLRQCKCMHEYIVRNGFDLDCFVGSSLIDMYARCGSIKTARQLFDKMSQRDVVSWTAMIVGYVHNGYARKALTLFHQMVQENIVPNSTAITSAISACGQLGALEEGKRIHDYIRGKKLQLDVYITTSLIDMYGKYGSVEVARQLFDKMAKRDVVSWNSMIAGYGLHGCAKEALELFSQMQCMGVKPNNVTFNNILSACRLAGLVDEAYQIFDYMTQHYHIEPDMQHYACMVDLLGRVGLLNEALSFIKKMPVEPDDGVWRILLRSFKIQKEIGLREYVSECFLE
ncbi:pentatricopeptide repeat-containing protein At3g12770 [Cryptomeria japonica]|uniref:pentatricopeptide repeat-containing protein At3g12770 n=1 Tax=Cryptomeria japonica TaxID=3369 RepID=UPI0027DA29D5|nr:pentatricopeptide repeat-containing protein At3g12770 [Cryptomeria japonica]